MGEIKLTTVKGRTGRPRLCSTWTYLPILENDRCHSPHAGPPCRQTCESVAELVATAQNLGHTDVLTTLRSYGQISRGDQRRLITGLVDEP